MKVEKLSSKYKIQVPKKPAFSVPTPPDEIQLHTLCAMVGARTSGKTLAVMNKVRQLQQQNCCDRVFFISPTVPSNRPILGLIKISDDDIYENPTNESLKSVLEKVEDEAREWEEYEQKKKKYERLLKFMRREDKGLVELNAFWEMLGGTDDILEPPKSKYGHKPVLVLIIDDCQGTPLFSTSSKSEFVNFLLRNRHCGSGLGLSCFLLVQSYLAQTGAIPRCVRENLSLVCLFKTKDMRSMEKVGEELGNVIEPELFMKAYKEAIKEPYCFLVVDTSPKEDKYRFRSKWDKLIIFDEKKEINNPV